MHQERAGAYEAGPYKGYGKKIQEAFAAVTRCGQAKILDFGLAKLKPDVNNPKSALHAEKVGGGTCGGYS
jgi:hypothetical protein